MWQDWKIKIKSQVVGKQVRCLAISQLRTVPQAPRLLMNIDKANGANRRGGCRLTEEPVNGGNLEGVMKGEKSRYEASISHKMSIYNGLCLWDTGMVVVLASGP